MRVRKSAEAEVDYFSSFSAPDIPLMKLTRRRSLPKAPPLRRKYSRPSLDTDNIPRNSVGYNPGPDSDYITYYNTLYNARSNLQNPRSSMEKNAKFNKPSHLNQTVQDLKKTSSEYLPRMVDMLAEQGVQHLETCQLNMEESRGTGLEMMESLQHKMTGFASYISDIDQKSSQLEDLDQYKHLSGDLRKRGEHFKERINRAIMKVKSSL